MGWAKESSLSRAEQESRKEWPDQRQVTSRRAAVPASTVHSVGASLEELMRGLTRPAYSELTTLLGRVRGGKGAGESGHGSV